MFFFFNDSATSEIYTLSLHDALPIYSGSFLESSLDDNPGVASRRVSPADHGSCEDRKSTRLNSSHSQISYAVFCLKKKIRSRRRRPPRRRATFSAAGFSPARGRKTGR